MQVKYVKAENDYIPKGTPGESILYEMSNAFIPDQPNSRFWLQCHQCGLVAHLGLHDEVKVQDDKVTISPSIDCPRDGCPAHYYIKNGEIQNC